MTSQGPVGVSTSRSACASTRRPIDDKIARRFAHILRDLTEKKPARQKTRDRILDVAIELFLREGFKGTPITDIERRAGLAAGTGSFYRHFPSKDAVYAPSTTVRSPDAWRKSKPSGRRWSSPADPHDQMLFLAKQALTPCTGSRRSSSSC